MLPGIGRNLALALGLSFLIGSQNAVVTQISNARVRTTHVTGTVIDIGIELCNLVDLTDRHGHEAEVALNKDELRLHGQTVVSFVAGGIVGVLAYRVSGPFLLFGATTLLLLLAARGIVAGSTGKQRGTLLDG